MLRLLILPELCYSANISVRVRGSSFLFFVSQDLLLCWCSCCSCTFTAPRGYAAPRSPRCGSLGFMAPLMRSHGSRSSLVAPWVMQFRAPHILQLPKFLRLHRCNCCGSRSFAAPLARFLWLPELCSSTGMVLQLLKLCCSTGAL